MRKAIALLSGGLDSSTLLYQLRSEDIEPTALIVDYGQRHKREITSAFAVAREANIQTVLLNLEGCLDQLFAGAKSSQVGNLEDVPHGHYAAESMKTTIVPNRNMMLISFAGALAETRQAHLVCFAAHAGDHAIYPDCRPEFLTLAAATLSAASDGSVQLYNPFINWSKTNIVQRGSQLKVPFNLTWSCYDPQQGTWDKTLIHCGRCGTCTERKEAFVEADIDDPTVYAA